MEDELHNDEADAEWEPDHSDRAIIDEARMAVGLETLKEKIAESVSVGVGIVQDLLRRPRRVAGEDVLDSTVRPRRDRF